MAMAMEAGGRAAHGEQAASGRDEAGGGTPASQQERDLPTGLISGLQSCKIVRVVLSHRERGNLLSISRKLISTGFTNRYSPQN